MTGPLEFAGAGALAPAHPDAMHVEARPFTVFEGGAFVERARWVWVCPCHGRVSGPWLGHTLANAWAEHAELLGGAK